MPIRLQRTKRCAALREGAVYVGRGSRWANPFPSRRYGHARAVGLHRAWLDGRLTTRIILSLGFNERETLALARLRHRMIDDIAALAGHDLICWCRRKSRWCHADSLIAIANALPIEVAA